MPIPHIFTAGDIAASSEVNQNFSYLEDIVGNASTPVSLRPPGDLLLGPRRSVQITAAGDSGPNATNGYLYLGWNAEFYQAPGGVFRLRRFNSNEGGAAVQIGNRGVTIAATHDGQGELNSAMQNAIAIRSHETTPYIYINPKWAITAEDEPPNEMMGRYRLTYVPVDPYALRGGAGGGAVIAAGVNRAVRPSSEQGSPVPPDARAIEVYMQMNAAAAGTGSKGKGKNKTTVNKPIGVVEYTLAQSRNGAIYPWHGVGMRAVQDQLYTVMVQAKGTVMLGLAGTHKGLIREISGGQRHVTSIHVFITGYYI